MCSWYCSLAELCFFFFKQKTAYEMRISDWSSDVCSSDLVPCGGDHALRGEHEVAHGSALHGHGASREPGGDAARLQEGMGAGVGRPLQQPAQIVRRVDVQADAGPADHARPDADGMCRRQMRPETVIAEGERDQVDRKSTRLNPVTNANLVC